MSDKIYIESYGCASSQSDAEIMAGLLSKKGYAITGSIEDADIIILNTCIVKSVTENRMRDRIKKLSGTQKKLIITGCMPEAERTIINKIAPGASMVSTGRIADITDVVDEIVMGKKAELLGKTKTLKAGLLKIRKNPIIDIVEICSGCSHACSYCITKLAKGALFSYPEKYIIKQIKEGLKEGVKEFWLTGQSVGEYGKYEGKSLPELIKRITKEASGNYFIRLGMMNPKDVLPIIGDLIEIYKNPHIFKFLHLPVQSGSDNVLEKMKRGYKAEDFERIVREARKEIPEITLWTDVIVGFPGETEDDFISSMELLRRTQPDFTNVSAYGARPYTTASKMKPVKTGIVKERTRKISALADEIALAQNKRWIGWTGEALVDEYNEKNNNWVARNASYKPIALKGAKLGENLEVTVKSAEKTHLSVQRKLYI